MNFDLCICFPETVVSSICSVISAIVSLFMLGINILTGINIFANIDNGIFLFIDAITVLVVLATVRWRKPMLMIIVMILTVLKDILLLILIILAAWSLFSKNSAFAQNTIVTCAQLVMIFLSVIFFF
ncbi:hypothetical protein PMAYCL1PPCAC_31597, partial [Pristionchus mayeri]